MASDQRDGAVVTGAASRIGRAIAAGLAKDGFSVVVADLDEANGRAAAKEIAAANQGRAIFQRVDVTDRRSVSAAIEACTRQFGSIGLLLTGNRECALEVPCCFSRVGRWRLARDFTCNAIDLDLEPLFLIGLNRVQRFGDAAPSVVKFPEHSIGAGKHGQI